MISRKAAGLTTASQQFDAENPNREEYHIPVYPLE